MKSIGPAKEFDCSWKGFEKYFISKMLDKVA